MQQNLKRIAALERANPPDDDLTIIRHIVTPGNLDAALNRIRADDGQLWNRLPGETEQTLIDRAAKGVKRNQWHAAILLTDDGEVSHADY
jgi:hypothetical protein